VNYYNEVDDECCGWLDNLIKKGLLPKGDIDNRSIEYVRPSDLEGYTQCHFFTGIGGWPYALRLAGWDDEQECWTGSCPCQPFSVGGKKAGAADPRHLWPSWFWNISQQRPNVIFGEQVAQRMGIEWFEQVASDLEEKDYAVGAAVLPASSVEAPHKRERLFFVADSGSERDKRLRPPSGVSKIGQRWQNSAEVVQSVCKDPFSNQNSIGEPGVLKVDDGIPKRVVRVRGYGNAIVPQVAALFIQAYMSADYE